MNTVTLAEIAGVDDWSHDPWGSALSLHFAICDVLTAAGGADDALAEWDYHRGAAAPETLAEIAGSTEDYTAAALAESVIAGELTCADLVRARNVLQRYETLAKRAGRDY
jgi:propanediol dehydratase small subunit